MQVSPIRFGSPFSISITFLAPNTLELDRERASIFATDFLRYREWVPISYSFLDVHAPENAPAWRMPAGPSLSPGTRRGGGAPISPTPTGIIRI
ncbi:MAG TPA: hypothetical protein PLG50_15010 [bacterium]|nr:hypothetical protein [bacterium]HQG46967.1 hypothetical protein [bacterium]HQI47298.1 hypothetical protein [bacterium]HQJ63785.1 hypothetical protein [bacterium]